jgi:hypothetical protein
MQATATTFTGSALAANILGIVAALMVAASMANIRLPLLASDRAAFIGLVAVGMAMCALGGIGRAQSTLGWSNPVTIVGIVIGALALGLVATVLAGRADFLAPVASLVGGTTTWQSSTDRAATLVLAALIALKWALGLAFLR